MDIKIACKIVKKFFGYKAKNFTFDPETQEVKCLLYDSFFFEFDTNDMYETFCGGIHFQKERFVLTDFLGESCALCGNKETLVESLQYVDDYCRKRLPDKFLKAYDKAYRRPFK